jgi:hypothetical protein
VLKPASGVCPIFAYFSVVISEEVRGRFVLLEWEVYLLSRFVLILFKVLIPRECQFLDETDI